MARTRSPKGNRPKPAGTRTHATGSGPDSVFVHAVRTRNTNGAGPVAVCGYPLRTPAEDRHRDERTFEDRWLATSDCCAECASALGLRERPPLPEPEPGNSHNWVVIGSVMTLVPMVGVLLLRVAAAALR